MDKSQNQPDVDPDEYGKWGENGPPGLISLWVLSCFISYLVLFEFPVLLPDEHSASAAGVIVCQGAACINNDKLSVSEPQLTTVRPAGNPPETLSATANRFAGEASLAPERVADEYTVLRAHYTVAEHCTLSGGAEYLCAVSAFDDQPEARAGQLSEGLEQLSIRGRVMTEDGHGLGDVSIVAVPGSLAGDSGEQRSAGVRFRTLTDALGAYTLDGLPDGEYAIRSSAQGEYQAGRIYVRAGTKYADFIVQRRTTRSVEGWVMDDSGQPLEGVAVLPRLMGQPSVMTGEDGRFDLQVATGADISSFSVTFERPGYTSVKKQVLVGAGELGLVQMNPVEYWSAVTGLVTDDAGEPLANKRVELRPANGSLQSALTDSEGMFEFPVVEVPARHQLTVFGGQAHTDYRASLQSSVNSEQLEIVLPSYEFGAVSGQLLNTDGAPVQNFELVFRNEASQRHNFVTRTDQSGNFEMPEVPAGNFVIAGRASPAFVARGLRLEAGEHLRLPLVFDSGSHEIRGVVLDANDNPVPASRIVLRWLHEANGVRSQATRRAAADSYGQFIFSDIGPGPHTLRVDAPGYRSVALDYESDRQGNQLTVRLN